MKLLGTFLLAISLIGLGACDQVPEECDEAIQRTLKAPSTYDRIEAERSGGGYRIEYDAENSYGVPLRGQGYCLVMDGEASWAEVPADILSE